MSNELFSCRHIDPQTIARAFGISLVVANHSLPWSLHGGLNTLLFLSGISFATIGFAATTRDTLRVIWTFLFRLVVYSILLAIFWCAVFRRFDPLEIGMMSNWFYPSRISKFPIWYTQAILQMFLGFAVLFCTLDLTPKLRRRPIIITTTLLITVIALGIVSKSLWDTLYLRDKLPHLLVWNVVLGWLFWAMLVNRTPTLYDRVLFTLISLAASYIMFVEIGLAEGGARIYWFCAALLLIVWGQSIRLPNFLAHILVLISQATLYIFLLHYPFVIVLEKVGDALGNTRSVWFDFVKFSSAVAGPVLIWAFITALSRTWSRLPSSVPSSASATFGQSPYSISQTMDDAKKSPSKVKVA